MKTIAGLIPLVTLWLILFGSQTICCLVLAMLRTRKVPSLDSAYALAGAVTCLYIATSVPDSPVIAGFALFMAGFAGFSAGAWSLSAVRMGKGARQA